MTAAAPSLSGQALPAVTVPPSSEDGLERGEPLQGGAGPRTVVLGDHRAVGQGDGDDLPLEEAVLLGLHGAVLGLRAANSSMLLAADLLDSATFSAVWPMAM